VTRQHLTASLSRDLPQLPRDRFDVPRGDPPGYCLRREPQSRRELHAALANDESRVMAGSRHSVEETYVITAAVIAVVILMFKI
jgi:hypothetical protein